MGGSVSNRWLLPAAGIGAGGAALFAVMRHHHDDAGTDPAMDPATVSTGGGGMNIQSGGGHGNGNGNGNGNGGGDGNPPAVPEPGTLLMMGAGIASFLGRKKILTR